MMRLSYRFKESQKYGILLLKRCNTTDSEVDPAILKQLDDKYLVFKKAKSNSLLKKHLTIDVFKALRTKRTKTASLLDCIQSGLANLDSSCGIYAPDADAYKVFADIFDPIIEDYHFGFKKNDKHPATCFKGPCYFGDLDPFKHYIASTRIRCARSLKGFPFNPCLTAKQYDEIEDIVVCTLSGLKGEFVGKYYPLLGMHKSVQEKLINDHILFKAGDRFLQAANASRFWPTGRGIFHNFEKTFVVWCNEEDHIRVISMQRGGDFGKVFNRLVNGLQAIGKKIPFARDERLGFLTFCPTNLGTTIRASVHIRLPKLASNEKQLEEIAAKYKLQVRGTHGEHSNAEGGIYDISNKRRLGLTEFMAVKELYSGISEIINLEKAEKGQILGKKDVKGDQKANVTKSEENKSCPAGGHKEKTVAKTVVKDSGGKTEPKPSGVKADKKKDLKDD